MRVKKVCAEQDIPVNRAIDFLEENPEYGIIESEDGTPLTKEELEHVKSFGPDVRIGSDYTDAPIGEVPEDSYRELFGTLGDNTE
jgi:hypothetical protein